MRRSQNRHQSYESNSYGNKTALFEGEKNLLNYNESIVIKFAKNFRLSDPIISTTAALSTLEFGAGSGTLAEIFRKKFGISPICVEIDPSLRQILKEKKFVNIEKLSDSTQVFNFVYTSNVLEHIENDRESINHLYQVLSPGGKIGVYVPALPFLFSNLDREAGHFRRYKKSELVQKFIEAGFIIDKCFYSDCLGVPGSLALRVFGYRNNLKLGSGKSLIIYDKYIYKVSRILDVVGFKYILGKNLFLIAHRGPTS